MNAVPINMLGIVSNAEDDMRKVYDLALIIDDYLSDASHPIDEDRKRALSRVSSDLLDTGARLRTACDQMYGVITAHDRRLKAAA